MITGSWMCAGKFSHCVVCCKVALVSQMFVFPLKVSCCLERERETEHKSESSYSRHLHRPSAAQPTENRESLRLIQLKISFEDTISVFTLKFNIDLFHLITYMSWTDICWETSQPIRSCWFCLKSASYSPWAARGHPKSNEMARTVWSCSTAQSLEARSVCLHGTDRLYMCGGTQALLMTVVRTAGNFTVDSHSLTK